MRQTTLRSLFILFVLGVLTAVPATAQCVCDLSSGEIRGVLYGSQFVDNAMSPTGFGMFEGRLDDNTDTIELDVRTRGLDLEDGAVTFALIRNSDGQVVTTFDRISDRDGRYSISADLDATTMAAIRRNPGDYTIRVYSNAFTGGAIEGPLVLNRRFTGTFDGNINEQVAFTTEFRNDDDGTLLGDFELFSDDIENIDSIELVDRETGETVDFFSESGTLIDGELFGEEFEIEGTVADDFFENPDRYDFVIRSDEVEGGVLTANVATANDLFVPVVGSTEGALGSNWETDLRLFNTSWDNDGAVTLSFYPRGGMMEPVSATVMLAPRETMMFDETMAQLFPGTDGIGALRISTDAEVVATARIFNDQRETGSGTFGQLVPALTLCDAMMRGAITGITDSTGDEAGSFSARTNVGIFNPSGVPVQVDLTLRDDNGGLDETRTVTLGPWMHLQSALIGDTGWFDIDEDLTSGTLSFEASAPVFVYGSVVDNDSGDPSTLLPQADFGVRGL